MENHKTLSVAHLWCDYYINADGNPHHYLKKNYYPSSILAATVTTDSDHLPEDIYAYSVKKLHQKLSISLLSRIKSRLLQYFYWKTVNSWAIEKLEKIKPTVLHVHFGYAAVRMLPLIKKYKLPVIATFYGVDGSSMIADPKWISKFKEAFKYISHIVVLSETVKERISRLGFPEDKILVWNIPIKLNTYVFREKRRETEIKFITAARFVEKKGYPFLIAAFRKVHSMFPNTKLTIIGYGSGKDKIEQEVIKHALENSVTIIDTKLRTDFHQFYYRELCAHDIFVLPSTTSRNGDDEGGPALTLVAAQASGLPVICTPFVGSEITVFDGKTGVFCKQDEPDSIAEQMIRLIENPTECSTIGRAASELVHPLFLEETQMKKLVTIYRDSLNN